MADANSAKSRLAAENFELVRANQEYEAQVVTFSKTKAALESQLDDLKRAMDEDARVSNSLRVKILRLQIPPFYYLAWSSRIA